MSQFVIGHHLRAKYLSWDPKFNCLQLIIAVDRQRDSLPCSKGGELLLKVGDAGDDSIVHRRTGRATDCGAYQAAGSAAEDHSGVVLRQATGARCAG